MANNYEKIDFQLAGVNGSTSTFYIAMPCACTVLNANAGCSADPGDGETITFTKAATAIGVLTYGTTIDAGDTGTFALNATTGQTTFAKNDVLKVVISDLTAAATFCGYIEIDPFVRVDQ